MSARNGDKSRFGRRRKQKIKTRERIREFRKTRALPKVSEEPAVI